MPLGTHSARTRAKKNQLVLSVSHLSPQHRRNSATLVVGIVLGWAGVFLLFFGLLALPISRVSILLVMTWDHGVRVWKKSRATAGLKAVFGLSFIAHNLTFSIWARAEVWCAHHLGRKR